MLPKTMTDVYAAAQQCPTLYAYLRSENQRLYLETPHGTSARAAALEELLCGAVVVLAEALKAAQDAHQETINRMRPQPQTQR